MPWLIDVPIALITAEDGLYGDVDAFLASYTDGSQNASWDMLEARNVVNSEEATRGALRGEHIAGCQ